LQKLISWMLQLVRVIRSTRDITWSSSDETVARVLDNGLVTALAAGKVQITAAVESAGVLVGM
jgi:hypothetical protein